MTSDSRLQRTTRDTYSSEHTYIMQQPERDCSRSNEQGFRCSNGQEILVQCISRFIQTNKNIKTMCFTAKVLTILIMTKFSMCMESFKSIHN